MIQNDMRMKHSEYCKEQNVKYLQPGPAIYQYVHGSHGHRKGVLVAFRHPRNNEIYVGWSLCQVGKERFCPHIGKHKAIRNSYPLSTVVARSKNTEGKFGYSRVGYSVWDRCIPDSIAIDVFKMAMRAYRYFFKEVAPEIDYSQITSKSPSEAQRLLEEMEDAYQIKRV